MKWIVEIRSALSRWHRVLPPAALGAGSRGVAARGKAGLCAAGGPGRNAENCANSWHVNGAILSHNATFETLVDTIDRELDETKRKALIRQADAIMEQDPPLLPVSWERINDAWYSYVKGHRPENYFGIYDVVRFDTFWMDK